MAAIPHQLSIYHGPPGECYLCLGSDETDELGRPIVTNNCQSRLANLTHVSCVLNQEKYESLQNRILKCPIHNQIPLDLSQIRNLPIDVKKVAIRTLKKMAANALCSAAIVQVGFQDSFRAITVAAIEALTTGVVEIMKISGDENPSLQESFYYGGLISCATLITSGSTSLISVAELVESVAEMAVTGALLGGAVGSITSLVLHDRNPWINEKVVMMKGALKGAVIGAVGLSVFSIWAKVGSYLQNRFFNR